MTHATAKIFWSWQNDYAPKVCRHFIRTALVDAIADVGKEVGVDDANRPEIDHDTKGERGMADIQATILNKIAAAAVFVADLTPISQSTDGKWLPNPNVMIELGWAMHRPGWERVVGILNTASGAKIEDLPFDIRQRRVVTFELAESADKPTRAAAKSDLVQKLKDALRTNLDERSEELAVAAPITGVAAKADNHSIWASAGDTLTHNEAFGGARRQQVTIPDVPRSYMRIIPAGWNNSIPSISDIARLGHLLLRIDGWQALNIAHAGNDIFGPDSDPAGHRINFAMDVNRGHGATITPRQKVAARLQRLTERLA